MCRACRDATQQGRPLNGPASRTPEVAAIPSCTATIKGSFVRGLLVALLAFSVSPAAHWRISACCLLKVANVLCTQDPFMLTAKHAVTNYKSPGCIPCAPM